MRIKICGVTSVEDGLAAVDAGADALGLMFYTGSPRCVTVRQAAAIGARLPASVLRVGVFVDPEEGFVRQAMEECGLDVLQFHGSETPEFCQRFGGAVHVWKAFRMESRATLKMLPVYQSNAWLLDSHVPGQWGGSGARFDWDLAAEAGRFGRPIVLAGGLTPDNVSEAIERVRPWGVDTSSGVERAPGRKDPERIKAFVEAVRRS